MYTHTHTYGCMHVCVCVYIYIAPGLLTGGGVQEKIRYIQTDTRAPAHRKGAGTRMCADRIQARRPVPAPRDSESGVPLKMVD